MKWCATEQASKKLKNKFIIVSSTFLDHNSKKLVINHTHTHTPKNKKIWKTHSYRLNNIPLNNELFKNEIKVETKRYIDKIKNENKTTPKWNTAKAVLREKFTVMQAYLKKFFKSLK